MISTVSIGRGVAPPAALVDPADATADPWASIVLARLLPALAVDRVLARVDRTVER